MLDRFPQIILDSVSSIPLPPLPQVLERFLRLLDDEQTAMSDLAALVSQDPAFTAQILTIATSFPGSTQTSPISLEKSLFAIGRPLLRSVACCMAAQQTHWQAIFERNLDYAGFWCHSLRVAALSHSLAGAVGYPEPEEAYLSGLLHDIGQLLLVGGVGEFCGILPEGDAAGVAGLSQILGTVDHAQAGGHLLDSWHLSSFMADAVMFHKVPAEQIRSAELLCRIVWSAHRLCDSAGEIDARSGCPAESSEVSAILGIEPAAVNQADQSVLGWIRERIALFKVKSPNPDTISPSPRFIYPYVSLPKRDARDAALTRLDRLARNMAVLQPLQESLLELPDEAQLYCALRETARLLFSLNRPVFLVQRQDRRILGVAAGTGQAPLLHRLEFSLEPAESLAASAFMAKQPRCSFDEDGAAVFAVVDRQLLRQLGSQGMLCIPMEGRAGEGGVMVFGLSSQQYLGKLQLLDSMTNFATLAARCLEMFRCLREREQRITADLTRTFEQRARKVIHEAVNPLGIISSYLNIFADKLDNAPEVLEELTILKDEISRVERIVRSFSTLQEQPSPVETVNVNNLIEGMLALYGESLFESRGIGVDKQLDPEFPSIRGDRDSLKQILFNLWKNSAEAMPAGGNFRIATCGTGEKNSCSAVEIRLSDSGPGIPADVMAQLFQPLEPGRRPANSGVGLSIVASLVEKLGGQVTCDSSPGQGTEFTIRLVQA